MIPLPFIGFVNTVTTYVLIALFAAPYKVTHQWIGCPALPHQLPPANYVQQENRWLVKEMPQVQRKPALGVIDPLRGPFTQYV
jgi:hypothetical protein